MDMHEELIALGIEYRDWRVANHLQALEDLQMNGLAAPMNFIPSTKPQAATKVINWISELVLRIIE